MIPDHFIAVLTVWPDTLDGRYRVTVLRRNGRVANTGRPFSSYHEACIFAEGLDLQARIMSDGKTRVLLDELSESESEDFALAVKRGPLTRPQVTALSAVNAGTPYSECTEAGHFARRSRALDAMIDRHYIRADVSPPEYSPETARLFLTPAGEKALRRALPDGATP